MADIKQIEVGGTTYDIRDGQLSPDLVIRAINNGNVSTSSEDYEYTIKSGSVAAVCDKIRASQKPLVIVEAVPHDDSLLKPTIVEATVTAYLNNNSPQYDSIDICWLRIFNNQVALEKVKFFITTLNRVN